VNNLIRKSFSLLAFSSAVRNCGQRRATWWNAYIRHSTYENCRFGTAVSLPLLSLNAKSSSRGNGIYSCVNTSQCGTGCCNTTILPVMRMRPCKPHALPHYEGLHVHKHKVGFIWYMGALLTRTYATNDSYGCQWIKPRFNGLVSKPMSHAAPYYTNSQQDKLQFFGHASWQTAEIPMSEYMANRQTKTTSKTGQWC